jgi:hypothetical protein
MSPVHCSNDSSRPEWPATILPLCSVFTTTWHATLHMTNSNINFYDRYQTFPKQGRPNNDLVLSSENKFFTLLITHFLTTTKIKQSLIFREETTMPQQYSWWSDARMRFRSRATWVKLVHFTKKNTQKISNTNFRLTWIFFTSTDTSRNTNKQFNASQHHNVERSCHIITQQVGIHNKKIN